MLKSSCTYERPGIWVASLFTRYPTALRIILESLKSIGQLQHAEINEKDLTVSYVRTDGLSLIVEKLRF